MFCILGRSGYSAAGGRPNHEMNSCFRTSDYLSGYSITPKPSTWRRPLFVETLALVGGLDDGLGDVSRSKQQRTPLRKDRAYIP